MTDKSNIEELKLQNEILKNKTEKLRLVRNIAAVASIIISIVSFLLFKQDFSSGTNINSNNTQIESNSNTQNNNISNEAGNNQSDDDNDNDDDDDDDLE